MQRIFPVQKDILYIFIYTFISFVQSFTTAHFRGKIPRQCSLPKHTGSQTIGHDYLRTLNALIVTSVQMIPRTHPLTHLACTHMVSKIWKPDASVGGLYILHFLKSYIHRSAMTLFFFYVHHTSSTSSRYF